MKSFDFLQQSLLTWYRLWEGGPLTCCVLVFLSSLILITTSMVQWRCLEFGIEDLVSKTRVQGRECCDGLAMPPEFWFLEARMPHLWWLWSKWPHSSSSWKNDNACVRTPDDIDALWAYYYHAAWVIFWDINRWVCFSCSTVPFFFFPV